MSTDETAPTSEPNMPVEIERKFLVPTLPDNLEEFPHKAIKQGYIVIGTDGTEVRLRDKAGKYTLTVKSKGELSRGECESALTREQFDTFWPTTEGRRVEKTRYEIPHGDLTIELDVYEGDLIGHVSAEIEFPTVWAADVLEVPDWLGADVTADSAYKNQNLATRGWPE
ncbi:MAG: CYTH domain-containing protein [Patescibacteria group bacterium]